MDACLVFPSMPAVMRLNKLGTFSMAQLGQSKSPFAEFMRSARKNSDNFEENLLKLVRTLPTVLKFLPSQKAKDARNFVQVPPLCHPMPFIDGSHAHNSRSLAGILAGTYQSGKIDSSELPLLFDCLCTACASNLRPSCQYI